MRLALVISGLLTLPAMGDELPFEGEVLRACVDAGFGYACIGGGAEVCMQASGGSAPIVAGPCFGAENAWWEARLDALVSGFDRAEIEARDYATEIGWPDPPLTISEVIAGFEAQRDLFCDYRAMLWGAGSGSGSAWMECRMRAVAEFTLTLEEWEAGQ